jgi:hypothetical protein
MTTQPSSRRGLPPSIIAFFAALVAIACGAKSTLLIGGAAAAASGVGGGGGADSGPPGVCSIASECAWGEIDHEILSPSDCPCLFGCPFLPLAKTTVDRRLAQYAAFCTPGHDGHGNPCEVDDCAGSGPVFCVEGTCTGSMK